ncbi:hypothetical protein EON63_18835 [archaeon]|nr:MAG: hypothetical protein EON63_18835 [archaeon]
MYVYVMCFLPNPPCFIYRGETHTRRGSVHFKKAEHAKVSIDFVWILYIAYIHIHINVHALTYTHMYRY